MKKNLLLLACFFLISIVPVFAWNYVQTPRFNVIAPKNLREPQSFELLPKVVDTNGIIVGYVLYNDVVGMNHNGQLILIRMQNGFFEERELYFEDKSCSGSPHIIFKNNYGFGWGNNVGFINSNVIYITNEKTYGEKIISPKSVLYSNGTCVDIIEQKKYILRDTQRIDALSGYVTPFKIKYDTQAIMSFTEWWRYVLE